MEIHIESLLILIKSHKMFIQSLYKSLLSPY